MPKYTPGKRDHHDARREARTRERLAAAAAYDTMVAARPLRPPPFAFVESPHRTAGACAAAKDRRRGLLDDGRGRFLDEVE